MKSTFLCFILIVLSACKEHVSRVYSRKWNFESGRTLSLSKDGHFKYSYNMGLIWGVDSGRYHIKGGRLILDETDSLKIHHYKAFCYYDSSISGTVKLHLLDSSGDSIYIAVASLDIDNDSSVRAIVMNGSLTLTGNQIKKVTLQDIGYHDSFTINVINRTNTMILTLHEKNPGSFFNERDLWINPFRVKLGKKRAGSITLRRGLFKK